MIDIKNSFKYQIWMYLFDLISLKSYSVAKRTEALWKIPISFFSHFQGILKFTWSPYKTKFCSTRVSRKYDIWWYWSKFWVDFDIQKPVKKLNNSQYIKTLHKNKWYSNQFEKQRYWPREKLAVSAHNGWITKNKKN